MVRKPLNYVLVLFIESFDVLVQDVCVTTFSSRGVNFQGLLRIVDIPGHERLRGKFFDEYKQAAKGIVYIIDSVTVQKDIRDVAE
jgi:signal recognition particle receptor subunit beta